MNVISSFQLHRKVALITGGARTLGYDMAEALAEVGCHLVITSRSLPRSGKAAAALREAYDVDVLPLALDVRNFDQVCATMEVAHHWKGHIDILINNVGGGSGSERGNLFERSPEEIDDLIRTNLIGTIYCCKEVGKIMAQQGGGKIINIASIAGMVGRDRGMYERNGMEQQPVDYAAAKAGVIGLTRDLAAFLAPYRIYVNSISPGGFERGQPAGFIRDYSERTALGRMGQDGIDIKGAVLFLASAASDYITGQNLVVDGGFSIWH
jgi:NAD(P)-dependent dehydrogenase (short-subunit alcohol dehydrogenase family)